VGNRCERCGASSSVSVCEGCEVAEAAVVVNAARQHTIRAAVLAYLRSLPAGGIGEVVAEARVARWHGRYLYMSPSSEGESALGSIVPWTKTGVYRALFGEAHEDIRTAAEARQWVEARARADGWHIARPATPKED
jgi:hypothetical protein